jgi:hypothetical protein
LQLSPDLSTLSEEKWGCTHLGSFHGYPSKIIRNFPPAPQARSFTVPKWHWRARSQEENLFAGCAAAR